MTEAGFGADLGAEKFFDIKCRKAGFAPDVAVVVATARALKMHGGVALADLGKENVAAVKAGGANLARHLANVRQFGVPAVVAVNRFATDTDAELQAVVDVATAQDADAVVCTHWADGSAGTEALAHRVVEVVEAGEAAFRPLYPDDMPLWDKVETVAKRIYHAKGVTATQAVRNRFKALQDGGYGRYPVCMAKTQYSFSTDPALKGAPEGHEVQVRELRPVRGRRVRGSHLRRHDDHAGPPQDAGRREHPHQRPGPGRRSFLRAPRLGNPGFPRIYPSSPSIRQLWMNRSMSPSRTASALPISTLVRWSLTMR